MVDSDPPSRYRVQVVPDNESFECSSGQALLDAAHAANVLIPYSCRGGRCGSCRVRLLEGDVDYPKGQPEALDRREQQAGFALCCSAVPRSHLVIELLKPELPD